MSTGIDIPIAVIRDEFANRLWTSTANKVFYALVDRNLDEDDNLKGEIFVSGNTYNEVHFDNKRNVVCFFDASETLENLDGNSIMTRDVGIIFAVNIPTVYPNLTYRAKEELYRDVREVILTTQALDVVVNDIVAGLNAYGDLSTEGLVAYNRQPWHTFRVNTTMKFNLDCDMELNLSNPYPDPIII